ncbi:MAG TPA: ATP-binding protein [Flavobacteriales bacterium]|nr:ATP-binding protein [Flavobacteriales bacterium]
MTRYFSTFLLAVVSCFAGAQNKNWTPEQKVARAYMKRSYILAYTNPDSALYYSTKAYDYSRKQNLKEHQAIALRQITRLNVLKGNVDVAMEKVNKAIRLYAELGDSIGVAYCYNLKALAYEKLNEPRQHLKHLLDALRILKKFGSNDINSTLLNLSLVYTNLREFEKALGVLDEASMRIDRNTDESFFLYVNYGHIYLLDGKYDLAHEYLDSALVVSRKFEMYDSEITALTFLGRKHHLTGNFVLAEKNYVEAIQKSRMHKLPVEESDALKGVLELYEQKGKYKEALEANQRVKEISDSLFNIEKIKSIKDIETRLKVEEKEKLITKQKLRLKNNILEQEKSRTRLVTVIAGSIVLLLALIFTVVVYTRSRQSNKIILSQKREVEIQKESVDRLNVLNQKIFSVIAHDFKGPLVTLQALTDLVSTESLDKKDFDAYTEDVKNQIRQSTQILDNLLNWARMELEIKQQQEIVSKPHTIANEIIKELGVSTAKKAITVDNRIFEETTTGMPPDIVRIVFRNLLSNAVKYSHPNSMVEVGVSGKNHFYVKDEGVGIDEKKVNELFTGISKSNLGTFHETGFGLGLYITCELINKFDGKIWVEKNRPSGTIINFIMH